MAIEPKKYFSLDRIAILSNMNKEQALEQLVDLLAQSPNVRDRDDVLAKILEREKTLSTGVGQGLALPHVKIACITDFVLAVGVFKDGLEFDSLDNKPAYIVVMIGCHESQAGQYMQMLSKLVRSLKEQDYRDEILACKTHEEIYELLTGPKGIS